MKRVLTRVLMLMGLASLWALGALGRPADRAHAQAAPVAPLRTPEQLASEARGRCEAARTARKPMLVTFGADWCPDCRQMVSLARLSPLASALQRYERLDINVGRFDRHTELTTAWNIRAISAWVVVAPTACDRPLVEWTRVDQRTLEPATGDAIDPGELASWLTRHSWPAASATPP